MDQTTTQARTQPTATGAAPVKIGIVGVSGYGGSELLRLCAARLPQRYEVDWLEQYRGKTAIAGDVRKYIASEREQDTGTFDQ